MTTLTLGSTAFCALGTPIALQQSSFHYRQRGISCRRQGVNQVRRRAKTPNMNLTNDIIIKGLEVFATTFVGNTLASQQAKKKPDNQFFKLGKKKRKRANQVKIDKDKVSNIVSEVLKVAEQVPEFVEKGGPEGKKWVKLAICILIDLVGSGSLGVPIVGDLLDLVTAPVSAAMLQALFGNTLLSAAGFAEEILPGTDAIPTATLAWLAENYGYLKSSAEERSST